MCNCISEIEKKIHDKYPTHNGKEVESVNAHVIWIFTDDGMDKGTSTEFVMTLKGQKKKHPVEVNHTYCPFCGIKYKQEDENSTTRTDSSN
ncbi:hypothetical protein [Flavobacterium beibuense]|uniref:hypothetical protein n=1 Tax=Flavobacterium beibuense TaxID=657326 RepID=UPI003A920CA3